MLPMDVRHALAKVPSNAKNGNGTTYYKITSSTRETPNCRIHFHLNTSCLFCYQSKSTVICVSPRVKYVLCSSINQTTIVLLRFCVLFATDFHFRDVGQEVDEYLVLRVSLMRVIVEWLVAFLSHPTATQCPKCDFFRQVFT